MASFVPNAVKSFLPPFEFASKMRFDVVIDGYDLGSWQKCTGIKVSFKAQPAASGATVVQMQQPPTYNPITLTRALTISGARQVSAWLSKHAANPKPLSAAITLRNPWGVAVSTWTIYEVMPQSWAGPDMDAGSKSGIATESLVLTHAGFLEPQANKSSLSSMAKGAAMANLGRAGKIKSSDAIKAERRTGKPKYAKLSGGGKSLEIEVDPQKLTLKRGAQFTTVRRVPKESKSPQIGAHRQTTPGHGPNQYTGNRPGTLTVNIILDSQRITPGTVQDAKTQLEEWTKPAGGELTKLSFNWAGWGVFQGFLRCMEMTNSVVDNAGNLTRAHLRLSLLEEVPATPKQNPSSGGIGEHRTHMLVAGDTLQSIAHAEYGNATAWRALADANGIDDPLRVFPGRRLLLPADL